MNNFIDVTFIVNDSNNNRKDNGDNNLDSENKLLIQFLKQKLLKKKPQSIPFSCNFEMISSFGKKLKHKSNTDTVITGLRNPYDIKIDNNLQLIFIADYGNYRIVVLDLQGQYLYHFSTQHAKPECLFVDQFEDRLLICCDNAIYCCNKKGENFTQIFREGRLFAVTMDSITKYIYTTDISTNKIIVIDLNGNLQFEIKGSGLEDGEFSKPYSLIFNSKRELLVSDTYNNRIQVFNCNGQFIKYINGQFTKNWGISVDLTNDNVLVADFINQQVHALDSDGNLIKVHEEGQLKYPIQLDYCSVNGCVYVCGESSNNVVIFK